MTADPSTDEADVDTLTVRSLLQGAVTSSALSQAAFATALGTSPARFSTYVTGRTRPSAHFCARALRLGRALGAAREQGLMSAPVTSGLVRRHLREGRPDWSWRMLLQGRDHLALSLARQPVRTASGPPSDQERVDEPRLVDAWEAAPGRTGSAEWDVLLAAVTARAFTTAGETAPAWTRPAPLPHPWVPEHPFLSRERVLLQTPDWLRAVNVFVPARDLQTA